MQQQQAHVMQISPLEGYAAVATALSAAVSCRAQHGRDQFLFTFESSTSFKEKVEGFCLSLHRRMSNVDVQMQCLSHCIQSFRCLS